LSLSEVTMFKGSKAGGASFKQTPDNLRSTDTFEGVLGVCVGPIKGPTRGLKSLKIDGTPLENETGESNFTDFVVTVADGDPAKFPQKVTLKLGAGAAPQPVSLQLTNPNLPGDVPPTGPGPWVTRTLTNTGADFIDLRFIVQQLYRQNDKGIYEESLTVEIEMKPVGATTWVNPTLNTPSGTYNESGGSSLDQYLTFIPRASFDGGGAWLPGASNFQIRGKTTSAAVFELRINVPNEAAYANKAWDIRARLVERAEYNGGDDGEIQERRSIVWESISAVYSSVMGEHEDWRGVAWLQVNAKASDQLTGVPEITGEWDTKIVSVPPSTIYNPETRQYLPGFWDGSWTKSWCNDPAWVLNDIISDSLSGLASLTPGSHLNKWDALELSKWCSELVPDGAGGTHPRYSMNLALTQPQKAEEFVRYVAGAVGALAWDGGDGQWRLKVDKPETPTDIFTIDNIDGEFVYSHTDVDTRFNDIIMQFKNAEMDYREDSVRVFDSNSIAAIGRKPTTLVAVGSTHRQETLRRAVLRLRSAVNEFAIVNFTTNRRGTNVEPLSVILIADADFAAIDQRTTGRAVWIAPDRLSLQVRDYVYLGVGVSYEIVFSHYNENYTPSPTTQPTHLDWRKPMKTYARAVVNNSEQRGNIKTLYFDEALPEDVDDNVVLALSASGLPALPQAYRVTSVTPQADGERVSISAINIDTGKWDAADEATDDYGVFQDLRALAPKPLPPLEGSVLKLTQAYGISTLMAQWTRPSGSNIAGFRVQHSVNGAVLTTAVERTQLPQWEYVNPPPGIHRVEISTINRLGHYSAPLVQELFVAEGPDQTAASLGTLWKNGSALVLEFPYKKGDLVTDQGATWIFTSELAWDDTPPPTLPATENAWWRQVKDATPSGVILSKDAFVLNADFDNVVIPSQLPKVGKATFTYGTVDVSSDAAWSVTSTNATATIAADGTYEITAVGVGTVGSVMVTGTYEGIVHSAPVTLTKLAPSPSAPSTTPDGSAIRVTSFPSVSASTFPSDPSSVGTVKSSSTGKLQFSAGVYYDVGQASAAFKTITLAGKLVYRLAGSSTWTDVTSATTGTPATWEGDGFDGVSETGMISISPTTLTGLTASTDYEFGVLLRRTDGNIASTQPFGSVSAQGVL
jgi:hypothetical protein